MTEEQKMRLALELEVFRLTEELSNVVAERANYYVALLEIAEALQSAIASDWDGAPEGIGRKQIVEHIGRTLKREVML